MAFTELFSLTVSAIYNQNHNYESNLTNGWISGRSTVSQNFSRSLYCSGIILTSSLICRTRIFRGSVTGSQIRISLPSSLVYKGSLQVIKYKASIWKVWPMTQPGLLLSHWPLRREIIEQARHKLDHGILRVRGLVTHIPIHGNVE